MGRTEPEWEPPSTAPQPPWGSPPSAAWASDNPGATLAILALCEQKPFYASLLDGEGRAVFQARKGLDVAVGSAVVVLPDDGSVYLVTPDGVEGVEQVRFVGRYQGDVSQLAAKGAERRAES